MLKFSRLILHIYIFFFEFMVEKKIDKNVTLVCMYCQIKITSLEYRFLFN